VSFDGVYSSLEKCKQMGYTCGEAGEILDASELRIMER